MESEPKLLGNAGVSRRQILARSAVAAGVVWAAPVVRTASAYAATSAGTTRPCTQFFVAGLSLTGNWFPAYPYGFVPSLQATENLADTTTTTTTTTTVPLATPGQGGSTAGVQTRRRPRGPRKLTRRELAELLATDPLSGSTTESVTVPKLIDQWVRENSSVPLLEPSVYPQITQTGAQGWAVLLPEVVGPNAAARQPRFILGYSWMGSQYAYAYVDPQPPNPALAGRRVLFPSPIGREPGVGDEPTTATPRTRRRRSTTSSSSSSSSSTTTTNPVAPTTATTTPGAPNFGPTPDTTTTSTSSTTTTSTTTTTTLPPTTTTTLPDPTTTTTTTTTLPPTTTTTKPGTRKMGTTTSTTTTTTTTTTVPPTSTSSTTTTTIPGAGSTTTTTTTSPGGTTTTTTDPFSLWWIAANSGTGTRSWDGLVPRSANSGRGATSGEGKKVGFVDTGVGPAGPAGPGALSPTDAKSYSSYFGTLAATTDTTSNGVEGAPIKGVILIYCQP